MTSSQAVAAANYLVAIETELTVLRDEIAELRRKVAILEETPPTDSLVPVAEAARIMHRTEHELRGHIRFRGTNGLLQCGAVVERGRRPDRAAAVV